MANKYDHIQQLIEFWQEFEKNTIKPDFTKFAGWLKNQISLKEKDFGKLDGDLNNLGTKEIILDDIDALPLKQQVLNLIFRLSRLQEFYVKNLFEGLTISTFLEFIFLFSINKRASLKKKEIIGLHLVEYSTGIDILKRLIKLELLTESRDELDKRSKRLKITSEGKRVLVESLIRMNRIHEVFFINFSDKDLEKILPTLKILDNHHKRIFEKTGSNSGNKMLHFIKSIDEVI